MDGASFLSEGGCPIGGKLVLIGGEGGSKKFVGCMNSVSDKISKIYIYIKSSSLLHRQLAK